MIWQFIKRLFHPVAIADNFTLYGGGGGTNTTVEKSYTPEEEAIRKMLLEKGVDVYNQQAGKYTSGGYPGSKPIAPAAETEQARQMLASTALNQGQQVSAAAGKALQFGLNDVLYPSTNPALQATIDTATRKVGEAYTDPGGVISQIRSNFTSGNSAGRSTREDIAGGLAARSYLNTIGDVTGQIASQGYGQGLDAFGRTLAFSPQTYQMMLQPASNLATVGASREAEAAAGEDFAAAQREWELNAPWMALQNLGGVFTGTANPGTVSTSNSPSNRTQAAAGGAMAGAAIGAQTGFQSGGVYGAAIGAIAGLLLS